MSRIHCPESIHSDFNQIIVHSGTELKKVGIEPAHITHMKKKLLAIPEATLNQIAADISITTGTREEKAQAVSDYYRLYSLRWIDIASRYAHLDLGN